MAGQTRTMLDGYAAGGRYRETVIGHSNVHHGSFGHVPIHTAIHPCGKGSNIRLIDGNQVASVAACTAPERAIWRTRRPKLRPVW